VFALAESFDDALQISFLSAFEQGLDAFLEAFAENLRAARKITAQNAFFRPHLVGRKKQRHQRDAEDQGQDDSQSRAHQDSSMFFTNMAARGWVRAAAVASEIVVTGF
jgi:hypothetical protein